MTKLFHRFFNRSKRRKTFMPVTGLPEMNRLQRRAMESWNREQERRLMREERRRVKK